MRRIILLFSFLWISISWLQAADYELVSPNGKVRANIYATETIGLDISYQGVKYLQIPQIQLQLEKRTLGTHIKIEDVQQHKVNNSLFPLYGINKRIEEHYNTPVRDKKVP